MLIFHFTCLSLPNLEGQTFFLLLLTFFSDEFSMNNTRFVTPPPQSAQTVHSTTGLSFATADFPCFFTHENTFSSNCGLLLVVVVCSSSKTTRNYQYNRTLCFSAADHHMQHIGTYIKSSLLLAANTRVYNFCERLAYISQIIIAELCE